MLKRRSQAATALCFKYCPQRIEAAGRIKRGQGLRMPAPTDDLLRSRVYLSRFDFN